MPKKLSFTVSKMILRFIAANKSNEQINGELVKAGHSTVSADTLSRYRNSPYIKNMSHYLCEEAVQVGILDRSRRLLELNKTAQELLRRLQGRFSEGSEAFPEAVKIGDILTATKALIPLLAEIRILQQPFYAARDAELCQVQRNETVMANGTTHQQPSISEGILFARMVEALKEFATQEGFIDSIATAASETQIIESQFKEAGDQ